MIKCIKAVVWGAVWVGIIGMAYAQFAKPEDAIEYRQAAMVLLGQHFSRIGAMVMGKQTYDPKEVEKNAALVETFAKLPWEAFLVPGTDKGDTKLKPTAFKDQQDFKALAANTEMETAKLAKLAASGDMSAVKAQFGQVGKSCKACHEEYRAR
jgi:cytochrome c556